MVVQFNSQVQAGPVRVNFESVSEGIEVDDCRVINTNDPISIPIPSPIPIPTATATATAARSVPAIHIHHWLGCYCYTSIKRDHTTIREVLPRVLPMPS